MDRAVCGAKTGFSTALAMAILLGGAGCESPATRTAPASVSPAPPTAAPSASASSGSSLAPAAATESLIAEALRLEDAGDFRGAIAKFEAVLRSQPSDVRAMDSIAGLHGKLGEFDEELRWTQKALEVSPDFVLAHDARLLLEQLKASR